MKGQKFQLADNANQTFEIYNVIESGICAVLLNKSGEKCSPNAKTLKFFDNAFLATAKKFNYIIFQ